MSASDSEDNGDPGQDTDNPLPDREDPNAAQPGDSAEHYVPWLGDSHKDIGLIPGFLLLWFGPLSLMPMLIFSFHGIVTVLFGGGDPPESWTVATKFFFDLELDSLIAFINWSPILGGSFGLYLFSQSNKKTLRILVVVVTCLFGFLSWAYCALVSLSEREGPSWDLNVGEGFQTWSTGPVPQSFKGCDARIAPKQASLFTTDIYYAQFTRMWHNPGNDTRYYNRIWTTCDIERFRSIQVNQTLCGQGFKGNNDLYGLGIRISLYLQWLSSFLANNFLPGTQQVLQKTYLMFSFAICLATIIASSVKACVFSIEIEVLYWIYWGGYICVFGSAPCPVKLRSEMK